MRDLPFPLDAAVDCIIDEHTTTRLRFSNKVGQMTILVSPVSSSMVVNITPLVPKQITPSKRLRLRDAADFKSTKQLSV